MATTAGHTSGGVLGAGTRSGPRSEAQGGRPRLCPVPFSRPRAPDAAGAAVPPRQATVVAVVAGPIGEVFPAACSGGRGGCRRPLCGHPRRRRPRPRVPFPATMTPSAALLGLPPAGAVRLVKMSLAPSAARSPRPYPPVHGVVVVAVVAVVAPPGRRKNLPSRPTRRGRHRRDVGCRG